MKKLNKAKYIKIQKKLNSLTTKDHNSFLGKMYLSSNDRSQNISVYQPTLDTLKKTSALIMFLVGIQRGYILLNLSYNIMHSSIA